MKPRLELPRLEHAVARLVNLERRDDVGGEIGDIFGEPTYKLNIEFLRFDDAVARLYVRGSSCDAEKRSSAKYDLNPHICIQTCRAFKTKSITNLANKEENDTTFGVYSIFALQKMVKPVESTQNTDRVNT